jgi:uracil-DNA glycosylase
MHGTGRSRTRQDTETDIRNVQSIDDIVKDFLDFLVLERELGTKEVEFNRALLTLPAPVRAAPALKAVPTPALTPSSATARPQPAGANPFAAEPDLAGSCVESSLSGSKCKVLFVAETIYSKLCEGVTGELFLKVLAAMKLEPSDAAFLDFKRKSANTALPRRAGKEELAAVHALIMDAISRLSPEIVVAFGQTALLSVSPGSVMLRDRWYLLSGVSILGAVHPADIVRFMKNGGSGLGRAKKELWNEMKAVLKKLGRDVGV